MTQTVFALLLFLFPLAYSPGPGNLFFAANGARFGVRATLPASLGYHIATWCVTALIGFGIVGTLAEVPGLFRALKVAGAVYVLWLAFGLLRAGIHPGRARARPAGFRDGVLLLLLNPKAYVIIALMFTQFLNVTGPERVTQVLGITTIFTLNNLLAFSVWTLMGGWLGARFANAGHARALNLSFALILGGVAVWMMWA